MRSLPTHQEFVMSKSKWIVASALAMAGVLGSAAAHAGHADVQWSVTVGAPIGVPVYTPPARVVTYPAPVYVQPAPFYVQQPYAYRDGYRRPYGPHPHYREPTRWDVDGDGIPNRYDRVYNPRWDRDGDGIPNWQERHGRGHWGR
jgi:hypothetical protein